MTELPWAIDRYADCEDTYWHIYNTKTGTNVCESLARETLEPILELLAFVEKCVKEHDDRISPGLQGEAEMLVARIKGE